jgi:hypothetical protein
LPEGEDLGIDATAIEAVPEEALPHLFSRAAALVYPSLYEGFGLSLSLGGLSILRRVSAGLSIPSGSGDGLFAADAGAGGGVSRGGRVGVQSVLWLGAQGVPGWLSQVVCDSMLGQVYTMLKSTSEQMLTMMQHIGCTALLRAPADVAGRSAVRSERVTDGNDPLPGGSFPPTLSTSHNLKAKEFDGHQEFHPGDQG